MYTTEIYELYDGIVGAGDAHGPHANLNFVGTPLVASSMNLDFVPN